jgi:hypothetical protein
LGGAEVGFQPLGRRRRWTGGLDRLRSVNPTGSSFDAPPLCGDPAPWHSPMESRFLPYFKPSSKLRMSSYGRPLASTERSTSGSSRLRCAVNFSVLTWFRPNFYSFLTVRDRGATDKADLVSILTQGLI